MIRWIFTFIVIGVIALLASWLAGDPGAATLNWMGYRIETSMAVVFAVVILIVLVAAILYRIWWTLRRMPRTLWQGHKERRRRKGTKALSRGLVAVAAGDAETAHRQARRASSMIDDPSLTLLLSAQAAQLEGDEKAAERFFEQMKDRRDTEFLGIRGLLTQAMKKEDWDEALKLARRAYRLNPRSEWVVKTLYDLQKQTGRWNDAQVTLGESKRLKLIAPKAAERERAEIQYQLSLKSTGAEAAKLAQKAYKIDPTLEPAAVRWVEFLMAEGRHGKAAKVLEEAWQRNPSTVFSDLYRKARQADDDVKWLAAAKRLASRKPQDLESRLLVATAALDAKKWKDARAQLEPVAGDDAPSRVCRLMARLEEGEHGDLARAREWLIRASAGDEPQALLVPLTAAQAESAMADQSPTEEPSTEPPAEQQSEPETETPGKGATTAAAAS
ncbi:MAG: tetratricopeptide repeat protein [Rhodospirillales bacterium]|nr:tetratricopeptide repeat protein [Rhodospirillales bacterium]